MDQFNPLPGRMTHRLNLDSQQEQKKEQQERLQREQYERQKQQKRKRKQEKRKAKQQQQRIAKQQAQKKAQQRMQQIQKYNTPAILFEPDSDSGVSFSRIKRKINEMYPKYAKKNQKDQSSQQQSEQDQQQEESEQDQESQSNSQESQSNKKKKSKKNKRSQRKRQNDQSQDQQNQQRKNNKNKTSIKIQPQMSAKDKLVQQVAIRWNYALPDWPPQNYNYQQQLNKKGYRNVQISKFKFVEQIIDGLTKVYQLDGYKGVYRSKYGLIDVRPKGQCPSLNYFYARTQEQLNQLLKKALIKQLQLLENLQFKQSGEEKLLEDLKRRVKQLVK